MFARPLCGACCALVQFAMTGFEPSFYAWICCNNNFSNGLIFILLMSVSYSNTVFTEIVVMSSNYVWNEVFTSLMLWH